MLNFNLLFDIYFIVEKDSNTFLVYTKRSSDDCISLGITNGIQVWMTNIDANIITQITDENDFGLQQNCISFLHSNLTAATVSIVAQADERSMIIHIGSIKPLLRFSLQKMQLSANEIPRLLFEMARRTIKLQTEIEKHVKNDSKKQNSPSAAAASLRPAPKLKPLGNPKLKKTFAPGMSAVNPRSRKVKPKAQGVQFGDT